VKVLDLSRLFPGPYGSLLLADLGADVVRVESAANGDFVRYVPPLLADGQSARYHALNRGKRSIGLNLKDETHRRAFEQLVMTADVVLESYRPGVLERMGLGPDKLRALNPRLIVCRISGYGQDGPDAKRAGHDLNYLARAGVLGMLEKPGLPPVQPADVTAGAWPAALQITAALYARERTREGCTIDVSMTDGAHAMLIMALADHAGGNEKVGAGQDLLSGAVPSYGVYPTKDGHLAVGALEPKFWMGFCNALELPELLDRSMDRGEQGDEVRRLITHKLAEHTTSEWEERFREHDCCVEPVRAPEDAYEVDPQLSERPLRVAVPVEGEDVQLPATPLSLAQPRPAAGPVLGEHTREVLLGWGVDHRFVDEIVAEG
jgi:crotonobetainyl-CoA:carnitine CoA-transferase CaiB-like acyl-CoA transferase